MVGKRVKVNCSLTNSLLGVYEGTVTSYKAESYDHPNFPPKFVAHETGLTIVSDSGEHVWLKIHNVEVLED